MLHLAEHFDVPLRERNALLLAAGYAPAYGETPLDAEAMAPVRAALDKVLAGHAPYPALIVDRRWDLGPANAPALALLSDGVAPELLAPPANTIRVCLHPDGLAPRIVNLEEYGAHLITRLERQLAAAPDAGTAGLLDELRGYVPDRVEIEPGELLITPLRLRALGSELRLFSALATFGTAMDVTVSELAIESFFPADPETEAALREAFGEHLSAAPARGSRAPLRSLRGGSTAAEGCGPTRGSARRDAVRSSGAAPEPSQRRAERAAEGRRQPSALARGAAAAVGFGGEDEME